MKYVKIIVAIMIIIIVGLSAFFIITDDKYVKTAMDNVITNKANTSNDNREIDNTSPDEKEFNRFKNFFFGKCLPVANKYADVIEANRAEIEYLEDIHDLEKYYHLDPSIISVSPLEGLALREAILYTASTVKDIKNEEMILVDDGFNAGSYLSYEPLLVFQINDVEILYGQYNLDGDSIYKDASLVLFKDAFGKRYQGICLVDQSPETDNTTYTFYGFLNTIDTNGHILVTGLLETNK